MLESNVGAVLNRISSDDRVLDVGGWARCFNRADWVIDKLPYATRGRRYGETLGLHAQGGEVERFDASRWVERDLCGRAPWPFADGFFDFCTCSHTLEDIRDPIWVCSEMSRVARAGYVEVPSMRFELTRGREAGVPVGLSHHLWVVERRGEELWFHPKTHAIHGDRRLSLPAEYGAKLTAEEEVTWHFWEGEIQAREGWLHREVVEAWVAGLGPFAQNEEGEGGAGGEAERRLLAALRAEEALRAEVWAARADLAWERKQHEDTRAVARAAQAERDAALARLAAAGSGRGGGLASAARRWLRTG